MKKLFSVIFPLVFLVAVFFSLNFISLIPVKYRPVLELLPYVLGVTALILGYHFNRSLVLFSAFIYLMMYAFLGFSRPYVYQTTILSSLGMLLSFNIMLLCYYVERGILSVWGVSRGIFIVAQAGVFIWLVRTGYKPWLEWMDYNFIPEVTIQVFFYKQIASLTILVSVLLMLISFLKRANPFRQSLLISMLLVLYATTLSPLKDMQYISVLVSFAMLLMLLTLFSESYRMAFIDELTELPGRRALNETLDALGGKYVIAMLDVDHFKKFNDTYGHDAGDEVLRLLGSKLKKVTGGGKPFRYGGEEFTVVFPGMEIEDVDIHLEQLRASVAHKKFILRQKHGGAKKAHDDGVEVTISIGYAAPDGDAKNPNAVIKKSDEALYRAKKKGRNCVSS